MGFCSTWFLLCNIAKKFVDTVNSIMYCKYISDYDSTCSFSVFLTAIFGSQVPDF